MISLYSLQGTAHLVVPKQQHNPQLGVQLAPDDDSDKSFARSTYELVLGIRYDTCTWSWFLSEDKLARLLHGLLN